MKWQKSKKWNDEIKLMKWKNKMMNWNKEKKKERNEM